jgi:sugar lactone lactonase YvrE
MLGITTLIRAPKSPNLRKTLVCRGIAGIWSAVGLLSVVLAGLTTQAQTTPVSNVQAITASLATPAGVAYDTAGNLYIADLNNHIIRKVNLAGVITTIAGTGEQGYAGDGGPATSALLDSPAGVAVDATGNIYIADTHNNRIRKVAGGTITTIAGTGVADFSGDGGNATLAALNRPTALAMDSGGNLYIADTDNHRIRKISGTTVTTVAGNGDQSFSGDGAAAVAAWLDSPNGVAVDAAGNIYIGDTNNQRVRVVNTAGIISTLAGTGDKGYAGDGGSGINASLARPRGLSVDSLGNIYFADSDNNRIRLIAAAGGITTVAGNGSQGFSGDGGPALNAVLDTPRAPAVLAVGFFALSDTNNQVIREVGSDAVIHTIAGSGTGAGESLTLSGPSSIVYGTGLLTATFSNGGLTATGQVSLLDITAGSAVIGSSALNANTASISSSTLSAGTHRLVLSYAGDAQNPAITSGVFVLTISTLPITATATSVSLQFGQAVPTIAGTLTGVLPQDAGNVTAVFSTTATSASPVGQYPITVALTGAAANNYTVTLTENSGSVTIGKTASRVTLSSSNIAPSFGSPITLTALAASTTTGTPTGNIVFFDGTTALATVAVNTTGSATYTSSAFAVGVHNITAVYSGDTNFATSTSTALTESVAIVPDFTFVVTGASTQSVNPGSAASYNFTLQPLNGSSLSATTLSASGLPPGATATFTPATVPGGSGTTSVGMSIQTAALQAANSEASRPLDLTLLPMSAGLFLIPLLRHRRARAVLARLPGTLLLLIAGVVTLGLSGCGSGGFFVFAPKTYTITVTATTTGAISFQHTATVTLIVQ